MGISRYAEKFREGYSRGSHNAKTDLKNIRDTENKSVHSFIQAIETFTVGTLIFNRYYNWILLALLCGSLLPFLIRSLESPRSDNGQSKRPLRPYNLGYLIGSLLVPLVLFFVFIRPLSVKGIDSGIGTTLLILAGLYSIFNIYKLITSRSLKWLQGFINPMIIFTWKFVGLNRFQMGYLFGLKGLILLTVAIALILASNSSK